MEKTYKIVRFYQNGRPARVMRRGLTLKQAQDHCNDPETSSETKKTACNGNDKAIARWHEQQKHWFDGYTEE